MTYDTRSHDGAWRRRTDDWNALQSERRQCDRLYPNEGTRDAPLRCRIQPDDVRTPNQVTLWCTGTAMTKEMNVANKNPAMFLMSRAEGISRHLGGLVPGLDGPTNDVRVARDEIN